ncbi:SDR family NAD(P)-dependent oxidoreductase [Kozakia baliensis]|uniref:Short-chain dehydrogenase n=1 Tax=Kozakia baliensis TaxID=153496 RepID=A0A1D8UVD8_9PROT|nr:SDR family oxidoreductase [Kozakia baliensis]AOX17588.1 short-chain dehydrogenase [Kozakia baliensis]GBR31088.1 short chain alcohol dehydrogenase [Kozakia baliensis NRIC 0488]GEL62931.1 oxidoreductase [Kozakia baliensis]
MNPEFSSSSRPLAILTGASGGIGRVLAAILVQEGYRVVALSRKAPELEPAYQAQIAHIPCDLSLPDDIRKAAESIIELEAPVRVLLHCAGLIFPAKVASLGTDDMLHQVAVNLNAPMLLTSHLLCRVQKGGRIVFVNSMAAAMPLAGSSVYAATKAGLRNFALSLDQEMRPLGVRVMSIFPGAVATDMLKREMAGGGSVLNFVSHPVPPEAVAQAVMSLIRKPKAERFFPAIDGLFARFCMLAPGLLRLTLPLLTWIGTSGHRRAMRDAEKN